MLTIFSAGLLSGCYLAWLTLRRFPRLLYLDERPAVLVPLVRHEFRPGIRAAPRNHRDQWLWWSWTFIRIAERVAQARAVPEGRLPAYRTFETWGMPQRVARRYVVALARAGIVEIRLRSGVYWRVTARAARWSALAAQSFADESDRPPRFRWQSQRDAAR